MVTIPYYDSIRVNVTVPFHDSIALLDTIVNQVSILAFVTFQKTDSIIPFDTITSCDSIPFFVTLRNGDSIFSNGTTSLLRLRFYSVPQDHGYEFLACAIVTKILFQRGQIFIIGLFVKTACNNRVPKP